MNTKLALLVSTASFGLALGASSSAHAADCQDMIEHHKAPIAFRAFPFENPSTGEKYLPNQEIEIAPGKKMLAMDYFNQLNETEQKLNAMGYSLREADGETLAELDRCASLLQEQASVFEGDRDKNPLSLSELERRKKELENKWEAYKQNIPSLDTLWRNAADESVVVRLPERPPFTAPTPVAVRVEPKPVIKTRTWTFEQGDKAKFWVKAVGEVSMTGSRQMTELSAKGTFEAAMMKAFDRQIAEATANAKVGKDQEPVLTLKLAVLNKDLWNPTYRAGDTAERTNKLLHHADKKSHAIDESMTWRFAVGPIPCAFRAGVEGELGIAWGYDVALTAVGGQAGPYAAANAYVQSGIDIGIAGAGIEGSLNLIKDTFTLAGDASVDFVDEPKIVLDMSASNEVSALGGKLSAYANVDLFIKKWTARATIWDWAGYSSKQDIFHFKYIWTPTGARVEGDARPEDVAEVASVNAELQLASFQNEANERLHQVMTAINNDLASPSVADVVREQALEASVSQELEKSITSYLKGLQQWLDS